MMIIMIMMMMVTIMSGYDNDNDDNDRGAKETSKRKEEGRVREWARGSRGWRGR